MSSRFFLFVRQTRRVSIDGCRLLVKLLTARLDVLMVVFLCCLYFFSFHPSSPVNGPKEVFDQDSRFIIRALERSEPYMWNPDHHILYHLSNEKFFLIVKKIWGNDRITVFYYLKAYTLVTAILFYGLFLYLLKAMGLRSRERLVVIFMMGVSVTAWFNFSAFETHGFAMVFVIGYLVILYRLLNSAQPRIMDYLLLACSILLGALARFEYWLLLVCTLFFVLFIPSLRKHWRPLIVTLFITLLLGMIIYPSMVRFYYKNSLIDAGRVLLSRDDKQKSIQNIIGLCINNIELSNFKRMFRAISVYSIVMPPGAQGFKGPIGLLFGHPLSIASFIVVMTFFILSAYGFLKRIIAKDHFPVVMLFLFLAFFLIYTFWSPHEPFLWTLEFLPLMMLGFANAVQSCSKRGLFLMMIAIVIVFFNNYTFFYRIYS